jgi:heat shock protein HslJ
MLAGRTFISQSIADEGIAHGLAQGTAVRLTFQGDTLSANAGCNTMSGGYTIDGGKLVTIGDWATTEMGCQPALQAQDQWLSAFLSSGPRITLNGDSLVLISGGTAMELLDREVAEPDQPLVGTNWTLSSLISGDAVSSVPAGVTATIKFSQDGTVEIHPGCNTGSGTYSISEDSIQFNDLATTDMACDGPPMSVESAVLEILSANSITYTIDSGNLTLMAGANGLQFTAS